MARKDVHITTYEQLLDRFLHPINHLNTQTDIPEHKIDTIGDTDIGPDKYYERYGSSIENKIKARKPGETLTQILSSEELNAWQWQQRVGRYLPSSKTGAFVPPVTVNSRNEFNRASEKSRKK